MRFREPTLSLHPNQQFDACKSTKHEEIAVGEVDEFQHTVDHRIAKGNRGIHKAKHNAVNQNLG